MSIGEVLAHLRTEFPDTTISKLRFLEAEGLVDPQRTASGYRKYSWEDVSRLRFVLTAQRDQYLPLRVIREQLDKVEHEPPQRPALVAVGAEKASDPADTRVSRDDLMLRTGVTDQLLTELEKIGPGHGPAAGLVRRRRGDHRGGGRRACPGTAWSCGTCARSGPVPTARWVCSRSCWHRWCASTTRRPRPGPRRPPVSCRPCRSACTPRWCGPVCAASSGDERRFLSGCAGSDRTPTTGVYRAR